MRTLNKQWDAWQHTTSPPFCDFTKYMHQASEGFAQNPAKNPAKNPDKLKSTKKNQKLVVVRVYFFSLSLPTKHDCCDVTMRAVMIWGLERGKERESECATCR